MNLALTPAGHLMMTPADDVVGANETVYTLPYRAGDLEQAFAGSQAAGIMALAGGKSAPDWPLPWQFWRGRWPNGKNWWTVFSMRMAGA